MKPLLLGLLCASLACTSFASSDQQQLEQKVNALRSAMIEGDRAALLALSAPQLSYGHSSGTMENQAEFVEKIASGKSDFVTMDLHVPNSIELGVLLVWQKQAGDWKLLARQAFKFPPKQ